MNEKKVLVFFLIFAAAVGFVDNYLYMRELRSPAWWQFGSIVLFILFTLTWYHYDSMSKGYQRSKWMNAGVLFASLFVVPLYLVRSREKGKKIKALLKLSGFVVLFLLFSILGGIGGTFIAQLSY